MISIRDRETQHQFKAWAAAILFVAAALGLLFLDVPQLAAYKRLACIPVVCGACWFAGAPLAIGAAALLAFGEFALPVAQSPSLPALSSLGTNAAQFLELATMIGLAALLRRSRTREREEARRDALTGVANRFGFLERVAEEMNRSRRTGVPLSLAYLDCDDFKLANDTLGHLAGDEILQLIATTIQANIRSYDCVGRLGGDEFAILFAETGSDTARTASERIRGLLKERLAGQTWPVTCSVGVAIFAQPEGRPEALLHIADQAMYEAKRSTRGGVRYVIS